MLSTENLAKGLAIVGRAVSSRSTMPVLANILLGRVTTSCGWRRRTWKSV